MKKLIVITVPFFFAGEAALISRLFENGMERLHLRKPKATTEEVKVLLNEIPSRWHSAIVVHDQFELYSQYGLGGIHLNSRHPSAGSPISGTISRSCHSIEELKQHRQLDYLFLSPLFESISKEGYGGGCYSKEQLKKAADDGIIDNKIIALGGICKDTIPLLEEIPFGGYAMLGAVWGNNPAEESELVVQRFKQLETWIKTI